LASIAFDPTVPVMDRHARGYPKHAEGEPATYGPWSEACATEFDWDAHAAAYSCPAIARRLGGAGALAYAPRMVMFVVDVDGPSHVRTPEWWAQEREKVRAAFRARGPGYCFTTRGGYRLAWGLADELVVDSPTAAARWTASYEEWIGELARDHGIIADDTTSDWTRLFRLPRVARDGGPVTVPDEEIGYAAKMGAWRSPYVPADDPRCQRAQSEAIDIPVAAPVDDDRLELAGRALARVWPPRGRHYCSLALCGALARAGWADEAIADFAAGVTLLVGGIPDVTKRLGQARDSADKAARGEEISGWMSLVERIVDGLGGEARRADVETAVLEARRALGQGPAIDLFGTVLAALPARAVAPDAVRAALAAAPIAAAELDAACAEVGGDAAYRAGLDDFAARLAPRVAALESKASAVNTTPMGMTYKQLRARGAPPPTYLVERLITSEGVGALSGEPKTGKSWDATHIAVAVASGRPAFGKFAVQRPRRVFYFYAEDPESSINIRIAAVAKDMGLDPQGDWVDNLVVQPRGRALDVMSLPDLCVLGASVSRFGDFGLVVLDPLSNIHSGEEDKRDSMVKVMARLHAVEIELGCAILFVHHSAKSSADNKGRKRGGQKMRGSSAVHGAVDFGIYVSNPRGDGETEFLALIESEVKSARGAGKFDRTIKITDDEHGNARSVRFTWAPPTDEDAAKTTVKPEERAVEIVHCLWKHGAPLLKHEVRKKVAGDQKIFEAAWKIAEDQGWIRTKYQGQICSGTEITESGSALVRDGRAPSSTLASTPPPIPAPRGPVATAAASVLAGIPRLAAAPTGTPGALLA